MKQNRIIRPGLLQSIALLNAAIGVNAARSLAPRGFDPQAAATAINSYSNEITLSNPPNYSPMLPNVQHGRVRVHWFTVTLASQAAGEDIAVAVLPAGSRILFGQLVASAALANSAQVSVGIMGKDLNGFIDKAGTVSDSVTFFKAAAVLSTTQVPFAITSALNYGYILDKECYLTLTTSVGTVATEVIKGEVRYVLD